MSGFTMIKCKRCNSQILPENQALNCHAHNDSNLWRPLEIQGGDMFEVMRTRVIEEQEAKDE